MLWVLVTELNVTWRTFADCRMQETEEICCVPVHGTLTPDATGLMLGSKVKVT